MRLLVGTNLFHPLYGGGEMALIDWLFDLHERGIEICVITTVPEVEGFGKEFPFEVIRLADNKPYDAKIESEGMNNYLDAELNSHYYHGDEFSHKALESLRVMPPFDYYIGYGIWGSISFQQWMFPHYKSFASVLKKEYPSLKTISLLWDVHGGEGVYETDFVLHGAPYKYIHNPHHEEADIKRFFIYPKQTDQFQPIENFNFSEWEKRPYDFIFNNPQLNKGSITVVKLAQHYKEKKFLIKLGQWGSWDNEEIIQLKELDNVKIIKKVTSMENEFYRKGKYLLSPSVIDGGGMMPLEAAMQGTIPLCSDVSILRYSSSPFAEFIFSEELGYNALNKMKYWNNYNAINFDLVVEKWIEKIDFLYNNLDYVEDIYLNLRFVENFVKHRYLAAFNEFVKQLEELNNRE